MMANESVDPMVVVAVSERANSANTGSHERKESPSMITWGHGERPIEERGAREGGLHLGFRSDDTPVVTSEERTRVSAFLRVSPVDLLRLDGS